MSNTFKRTNVIKSTEANVTGLERVQLSLRAHSDDDDVTSGEFKVQPGRQGRRLLRRCRILPPHRHQSRDVT